MIRDDSHIDYTENDNYRSCLNEEKHERLACSKKMQIQFPSHVPLL